MINSRYHKIESKKLMRHFKDIFFVKAFKDFLIFIGIDFEDFMIFVRV